MGAASAGSPGRGAMLPQSPSTAAVARPNNPSWASIWQNQPNFNHPAANAIQQAAPQQPQNPTQPPQNALRTPFFGPRGGGGY